MPIVNRPSEVEIKKPRRPNLFSNIIASVVAIILEQTAFHPMDTASKAKMQEIMAWNNFKNELKNKGILSKIKRLYKGYGITIFKKIPIGMYKYPSQKYVEGLLSDEYAADFTRIFKSFDKLAITTVSAAGTAAFEPTLIHAIDTLQVRKQVLQEKINLENMKRLGFTGLWRGALFTGIARNVPGAIGLFTGSAFANQLLNNEDKSNHLKDLIAKWFGSSLLAIATQPGDLIKSRTHVQQIPAREVVKSVNLHTLLTRGLFFRLAHSSKVGVGYFFADVLMRESAKIFGDPVNDVDELSEKVKKIKL